MPRLRGLQNSPLLFLLEYKKAWESFTIFKKWIARLFHHHNKKLSMKSDGKNEHSDQMAVWEFRNQSFNELKSPLIISLLNLWYQVPASNADPTEHRPGEQHPFAA